MPEEQAKWRTRRRTTTTTRTRSSATGAAFCAGICTRWPAHCSRTLLRPTRSARRWGRAATSTLAAWSSSSSWWRTGRSCRHRPRTWVSSRCPAPPPTARGPSSSSCSPRAAAPPATIGRRRARRAEAGRPWRPPECRRWPAPAALAARGSRPPARSAWPRSPASLVVPTASGLAHPGRARATPPRASDQDGFLGTARTGGHRAHLTCLP
mmetsp:Transcript_11903/g.33460  ORF Transcript_11903/g.33460 Transcript_11903/m.33460 type:complete len:210 (+) Transcript_11903:1226-1855(+)